MGPHSWGTVAADPRHSHSIELELHDLNQLFNSMDPSPFNAKDLDHDAEEFIVSWAQEYPLNQSVTAAYPSGTVAARRSHEADPGGHSQLLRLPHQA